MTASARNHSEATPCGWSKTAVQTFAARAAAKLGYKPGDDLEGIIRRLGGKIVVSDFESASETGSISVNAPDDFTISLSPFSGRRRSRFTMAHELAHYILHSKLGKVPICVKRDGTGRIEWEANWFAAGFLMPDEEFKSKLELGWSDAELAAYFDVSEAAVQVRRESI